MIHHKAISDRKVIDKIKNKEISFGGNNKLKIYGTLSCSSGKRMNRKNRVFFNSEEEAREKGFRPCGHCMRAAYLNWKDGIV